MAIPINKQGGRATYYYPGDGYLRRYDDFGVTQISLEAWTRRQDAEKAFWGGSVRWVDDPRIRLCILNRTGSKAFGARNQRRPSSDARGQESSRPLESGVNRTPTTPFRARPFAHRLDDER